MGMQTAKAAHVLVELRSLYQGFLRKKIRLSIDSYLLINLEYKCHQINSISYFRIHLKLCIHYHIFY